MYRLVILVFALIFLYLTFNSKTESFDSRDEETPFTEVIVPYLDHQFLAHVSYENALKEDFEKKLSQHLA